MERNKIQWRERPRTTSYRVSGAVIRINPELLVARNDGQQLLLKLYLKDSGATQAELAGPLYLLEAATREARGDDVGVGILDARRGRVFTATRLPRTASITAASEVESLVGIWKKLDSSA